MSKDDLQLWRYADHRERADKLLAEGKPLSVHFDGLMYVHSENVHAPLWIGDTYVWITLPLVGGEGDMHTWWQAWRRRAALR